MGLADKLALTTMARTCSFNPVLTLTYCLSVYRRIGSIQFTFSRYSSFFVVVLHIHSFICDTNDRNVYTVANIMFTFTKHKKKPVNLVNNGNGLAGLALWFVLTSTNIIYRKYTHTHTWEWNYAVVISGKECGRQTSISIILGIRIVS